MKRDGGAPGARRCAHPPARNRRTHRVTHRGLLDARLRRARHQDTSGHGHRHRPWPAPCQRFHGVHTVRPRMRRPRLTCHAARLPPRPTSRPAVALLPARHWAPPGARDSLTKPRRRGWIWLWYKLICTRDWVESTQSETPQAPSQSERGMKAAERTALLPSIHPTLDRAEGALAD